MTIIRQRFSLGTYYTWSLFYYSVGTNGETERGREGENKSQSQKDRKIEREKQGITNGKKLQPSIT